MQLTTLWFRDIENLAGVMFAQLADPGRTLEHYDGKIQIATLKAVPQMLKRKIQRVEDRMYKEGNQMAGRQALRMVRPGGKGPAGPVVTFVAGPRSCHGIGRLDPPSAASRASIRLCVWTSRPCARG